MIKCENCKFNNPKGAITAIIFNDNKLLMLKRNEEPFNGRWDLPGGYMNATETPEGAMGREIKEEMNCEADLTFIKVFPGNGYWKDEKFPIISHVFLAELKGEIQLNNENSDYQYRDLKGILAEETAFDSNIEIIKWLQTKFIFDLDRVRELMSQLDSTAELKEYSLYKAILQGYLATEYDGDKLIGMGWAFPRQTLLRKQAVVEDMIVDESQRGRGLGTKILRRLHEMAKEDGVEMIELTTNPKRIAANELYKKEGYWLHETNHYLKKI